MSVKNSYTTSDYLEWNTMINLIQRLYRDGNYRMSLLLGCGSFFGLRISDILTLTWAMLLDGDKFTIEEKKTKKRREIKINKNFQKHIKDCYDVCSCRKSACISQKNTVYSIQRINVLLKDIKASYGLKIGHFSTHSMRKTFGRKVVEQAGPNSEMALIKLSELFNHSSVAITKIYLGIRQEELLETYDLLSF